MLVCKNSLDLTPQQLEVITSALQTQEKILSVQSRAGKDDKTRYRLLELQSVLRRVQGRKADVRPGMFHGVASMFRRLKPTG